MPNDGSELVGRLLLMGFTLETTTLADNPLPLILSLSMASSLNCTVFPHFSNFLFYLLLSSAKWERGSSLAALCGSRDLSL